MKHTDPMFELTKKWYASVYGSGQGARQIILAAKTVHKTSYVTHGQYQHALPEEDDAWKVGTLAQKELASW
jgi:hypothetical protein